MNDIRIALIIPTGVIGHYRLLDFNLKQATCTFFNENSRRCGHKASYFYLHIDGNFVPRCKIHRGLFYRGLRSGTAPHLVHLPTMWVETTLIELQTKQRMGIINDIMED